MVAPTLLLASSILLAVTTISARPPLSVSEFVAELVAATGASSAKPVPGMTIPAKHNKLLVWRSFAVKRDDMLYPPRPVKGIPPYGPHRNLSFPCTDPHASEGLRPNRVRFTCSHYWEARGDTRHARVEVGPFRSRRNSAVPVSGDIYKQIGRNAAGPVCIAAAYDRTTGAVVGLTASSFVTLSFEPPMVMFALQQHADSYASIVSSKAFGVSLLGHEQSEVAALFATKGREKIERTS